MKTPFENPREQQLKLKWLIALLMLLAVPASAQPDLRGYKDAFGNGFSYPFDVRESAVNWGDNVTLYFAVVNSGAAAAGAFKIAVYISSDTTITTNDYRIVTLNVGSMAASSGTYVSNGVVTLPSVNPLPGAPTNIYFGMIVDLDNQVSESNESNNSNQGTGIDRDDTLVVITPPRPDIFVTDSVLPGDDRTVPFSDVADDGPGNARGVQTLTIINKGKGALTITNFTLSGSPYFSVAQIASSIQNFISPASLPRTIAKNGTESWVLTLQFDPATNASASATLAITSVVSRK